MLVRTVVASETGTNSTTILTNELGALAGLREEKDLALVRKTYEAFFARFTTPPKDEKLAESYADHAYRFHELLVAGGERKRAVSMLRLVLKCRIAWDIRNKVAIELADLDVYLAEHSTGDERKQFLKEADSLIR